jgi:hypothetical protein
MIPDSNRIDRFSRSPTNLRNYREYVHRIQKSYGSVLNFMVQQRLCWTDMTTSGSPFSDPADIKITHNDWPYGVDPRIVHLVVWCKFDLPDDPATGLLRADMKDLVERFVTRVFRSRVGDENVRPCPFFSRWQ